MSREGNSLVDLPYVVDLDTGENRLLGSNLGLSAGEQVLPPRLSPDGRIIGLTTVDGPDARYHLVATADGRSVQVGEGAVQNTILGGPFGDGAGGAGRGEVGVGFFNFSPDSQFVLLRYGSFSDRALRLMRRNGGRVTAVEINGEAPYQEIWIPGTSKFLAVGDNSTGTGSLLRVTDAETLQGTDYSLLPSSDLYIEELRVAEDGSKVAVIYSVGFNEFLEVGCLNLEDGAFTEFDAGTDDVDDNEVAISDDGRFVAFAVIDEQSGENERAYMARTSDGMTVRIDPTGTNPNPCFESLRFEPGGERLTFIGDANGSQTIDLYLAQFDAATINLSNLGLNEAVEDLVWRPASSAAARHVAVLAERSVADEVSIFDAAVPNASAVLIPLAPGDDPRGIAWSGDGTSLLVEVDAPAEGRVLRSWRHAASVPTLTLVGPCVSGTLRPNLDNEGGMGGFGQFGTFSGRRQVSWIRNDATNGADELMFGDPENPSSVQVMTPPVSTGGQRTIRSIATRIGPPTEPGPK